MIDVDWVTGIITVPKADTTLVQLGPPEVRRYDLDGFRSELNDAYAETQGGLYSIPYLHETESTISGVVYARKYQILSPYTVEFENGSYQVELFGANHNFLDVRVVNDVSLIVNNSAGLQTVTSGSGVLPADVDAIAAAVWDRSYAAHTAAGSFGWMMKLLRILGIGTRVVNDTPATVDGVLAGNEGYLDDGDASVFVQGSLKTDAAGTQTYDGTGAARRNVKS